MVEEQICVRAENISKKYRVGEIERYGRLTESLWETVRSPMKRLRRGPNDHYWALKNVSLELRRGEVVGLIGRNGAGKTTLLKILSRITEPTTGTAVLRGRVGSLLEVGIGFHPELTGRENIYLNGALLGMRRSETQYKFDEIVQFAEVEQFLDTPVKRYSSGMHVRLAFSIAAHLQPEIFIVDEVLSVGDAAFQKRCVEKIAEVARGGGTVIFVTHNMATVHRLCTRCLLLDAGEVRETGPAAAVIAKYVKQSISGPTDRRRRDRRSRLQLLDACFLQNGSRGFSFINSEPVILEVEYLVEEPLEDVRIGAWFMTIEGMVIMTAFDTDSEDGLFTCREPGRYRTRMTIPPYFLNSGEYSIRLIAYVHYGLVHDENSELVLQLSDPLGDGAPTAWGHRVGPVIPSFKWKTERVAEPRPDY